MEIINVVMYILLIVLYLTFYFGAIRNQNVYSVINHFINCDELYPAAFRALPSYNAMVFHPRYQHLWTKSQWVKWVKAQGVAA